jgi:photosystem II stability/assembly factor-like uncharacterized protein
MRMNGQKQFSISSLVCLAAMGCGSRGPIYSDLLPRQDAGVDASAPRDAHDVDAGVDPTCPLSPFSEGFSGGPVNSISRDLRLGEASPVVYATSANRLYRSDDRGATWMLRSELEVAAYEVAYPATSTELLLGTSDGVYISRDEGRTFAPYALQGLAISALVTHPTEPARVFASVNGLGLMRSSDGGQNWGPSSVGLQNEFVWHFSPDPRDPGVVIASSILFDDATGGWTTRGRVLRTDDGGVRWYAVAEDVGATFDLRRCAAKPNVMYASHQLGLSMSIDGGRTFTPTALTGGGVFGIEVTGENCENVSVLLLPPSGPFGLHISRDGGATFEGPFVEGYTNSRTPRSPFTLLSTGGSELLIRPNSGLFLSENEGRSMRPVGSMQSVAMRDLVSSNGHLWASTWGSGLWVLDANTARWERTPADVYGEDYALGVLPITGDMTSGLGYVGSWGPIYRRNAGRSFEAVAETAYNAFGLAQLRDGNILAATQTGGIRRSEDGGVSFIDSSLGVTPWTTPVGDVRDFRTLMEVPGTTNVVLAGSAGAGIWRSVDNGYRWTQTSQRVGIVMRFVHDGARSYALTESDGILVSDDQLNWRPLNEGLVSLRGSGLAVDDVSGRVFAALGGAVYELDKSVDPPRFEPFGASCRVQGAGLLSVADRPDGRWLFVSTGADGFYRAPL